MWRIKISHDQHAFHRVCALSFATNAPFHGYRAELSNARLKSVDFPRTVLLLDAPVRIAVST
jgi:hypothetical protein